MKFKIICLLLLIVICFNSIYAADNLTIYSNSVIAMDADSGVVLYSQDMNKKIYPASTTKILTAILAIENLDLEQSVVVSKTAIAIPWDSSSVYLKEGEVITVKELLYCLLLNSGNDAANVLAEAVSGNIANFVELMNKKLIELSCTNTHFNNAHGYSDDNHYTTAFDMATIFKYCIKNKTFTDIISTKSYVVNETNKTDEKRYLYNTNRLILQKEDSIYARYYEYCVGGKTGYTDEAGRTLITFAKKEDKTVIVGVFGAAQVNNKDARYTDAITLFEYSFNNFSKQKVAYNNNYNFEYINIEDKKCYLVGLKNDFSILAKEGMTPQVTYSISIDSTKLKGNFVDTNTPVGTITFNFHEDQTYHSVQDLYLKDVSKYKTISASNVFVIIFIIIFLLFILYIIYITTAKNKKYKKTVGSRKERRKS